MTLSLILLMLYGGPTTSTLNAEYVSNYDGDTVTVALADACLPLFSEMSIRVRGVDTPEIRGKCDQEKLLAKQASSFVRDLLSQNSFRLTDVEKGKYFRLVATIMVNIDGDEVDLADLLVTHGMGRSYDGGKRLPWCN